MGMTTMELDAVKARLMDDISQAYSMDDLKSKLESMYFEYASDDEIWLSKDYGRIPGIPSTKEEVKLEIAKFQQELSDGTLETLTEEEADAEILREMPWLR